MSEMNLAFRVTFMDLESAVACKHFIRAWRDGKQSLGELSTAFSDRLPEALALAGRLEEAFPDGLMSTTITFEGNRHTMFYYSIGGNDGIEKRHLCRLLCGWLANMDAVTQVVQRESGDNDAFTVYQDGSMEELCIFEDGRLIDWLLAQSDEILPVSIYDLPVLFLKYQGDLQAAMEAEQG